MLIVPYMRFARPGCAHQANIPVITHYLRPTPTGEYLSQRDIFSLQVQAQVVDTELKTELQELRVDLGLLLRGPTPLLSWVFFDVVYYWNNKFPPYLGYNPGDLIHDIVWPVINDEFHAVAPGLEILPFKVHVDEVR